LVWNTNNVVPQQCGGRNPSAEGACMLSHSRYSFLSLLHEPNSLKQPCTKGNQCGQVGMRAPHDLMSTSHQPDVARVLGGVPSLAHAQPLLSTRKVSNLGPFVLRQQMVVLLLILVARVKDSKGSGITPHINKKKSSPLRTISQLSTPARAH